MSQAALLARGSLLLRARGLPILPSRAFAQAAAAPITAAPVAPPASQSVQVFGLDGTYATALYKAAVKTSSVDATARATAGLRQLLERDRRLATVLTAPTLTPAHRAAVAAELQKHVGAGPTGALPGLLTTLAENNRLGLLGGVCAKFDDLIRAAQGQVELIVTSAKSLDTESLNRLVAAVKASSHVPAGGKLKLTNKINPELIGGVVVEIGDRTIDMSVSSRVTKLNKLLFDVL